MSIRTLATRHICLKFFSSEYTNIEFQIFHRKFQDENSKEKEKNYRMENRREQIKTVY